MKPTLNPAGLEPLVAFGAHPDDLEFGCGGVLASEARAGRPVHLVVCSRGEAGSYGTPEQREVEAQTAAAILGASIEFIELDGDAHLEVRAEHSIRLAAILRERMPSIVFAPSTAENQHPDHWRLGKIVRDAARLARYGGLKDLEKKPHVIGQLYYYAVTAEAEPAGINPLIYDVSDEAILAAWKSAMEAHVSQVRARNYIELQLTRARLLGARGGIGHGIPLFPNDPLIIGSLEQASRGARRF